jgi:glycerol-3-phosphate acyltransferase PlsY
LSERRSELFRGRRKNDKSTVEMSIFIALALICAAYLVGSIPTGYWLVKALKGIDIRKFGSGSTGATNVWRCVGKGAGITVFAFDLFKGILPVVAGVQLESGLGLPGPVGVFPVLMAAASLFGHSRSIFLGFQGGKSAATGLGTLLALNPLVGALTFATWLVVVAISRIVSVGSIAAVFSCIFYMALLNTPVPYVVYCVAGFFYVTLRHKENIKRLLKGTEPRIGDKPANQGPPPEDEPKGDNLKRQI